MVADLLAPGCVVPFFAHACRNASIGSSVTPVGEVVHSAREMTLGAMPIKAPNRWSVTASILNQVRFDVRFT